jgi:hypothetical protein
MRHHTPRTPKVSGRLAERGVSEPPSGVNVHPYGFGYESLDLPKTFAQVGRSNAFRGVAG